MSQDLIEMAKDLVAAQIRVHHLSPDEANSLLRSAHATLLSLHQVEAPNSATTSPETDGEVARADWKRSITRHTIICLECGDTFRQLSARHLRVHDLDPRSYRTKYGIPRTQPLIIARGHRSAARGGPADSALGGGGIEASRCQLRSLSEWDNDARDARSARLLPAWMEYRFQLFMDDTAQHRFKRPVSIDVCPQGIVDQTLVIAAVLVVNLLPKPSQNVLIQADRNALFSRGHRIERPSAGTSGIICDFGNVFGFIRFGIVHNTSFLFW